MGNKSWPKAQYELCPGHLWGNRLSLVSFLFVGRQHALSPRPGPFDCRSTKATIEMMEVCCPCGCSICPLPITSTAIPQSPFISCLFAAITDRWAFVIYHTLQCQQQPQDEWLRSSVVLWTRGCASSFTKKQWIMQQSVHPALFPLPMLKLERCL